MWRTPAIAARSKVRVRNATPNMIGSATPIINNNAATTTIGFARTFLEMFVRLNRFAGL